VIIPAVTISPLSPRLFMPIGAREKSQLRRKRA
jgi:hypothetical protein